MRSRSARLALILVAALPASLLCAHAGSALTARAAACFPASAHAKVVRFTNSAGTKLVGYELGRGPRGVVLAHQYGGDACQWAGYAPGLARRGYHVLAFDFHGNGLSAVGSEENDVDVVAAAAKLRTLGAKKLVLIGASMGGTASN